MHDIRNWDFESQLRVMVFIVRIVCSCKVANKMCVTRDDERFYVLPFMPNIRLSSQLLLLSSSPRRHLANVRAVGRFCLPPVCVSIKRHKRMPSMNKQRKAKIGETQKKEEN